MSSTMETKALICIPRRPDPFGHHIVESVVPSASSNVTTRAVAVVVTATATVAATAAVAVVTATAITSRTANPTWKRLSAAAIQRIRSCIVLPSREMQHKGRALRRASEKPWHEPGYEGRSNRSGFTNPSPALPLTGALFASETEWPSYQIHFE